MAALDYVKYLNDPVRYDSVGPQLGVEVGQLFRVREFTVKQKIDDFLESRFLG